MPLLNKQLFKPQQLPTGVDHDAQLYYCKPTKELFLNHEEYFNRMMMLNTTVWSCSFTRKSNLTYFEAMKSEQEAETELRNFPEYLERPILFIVHNYTNRGRFEELVNDVYHIMKDRYFTNEEVYYMERNRKLLAQIVTSYTIDDQQEIRQESESKEPVLQSADVYRYTVRIVKISSKDEDDFRENVTHDRLFRPKLNGARQKIRLFLKHCCHLPPEADRYSLRDCFVEKISEMWWTDVMSGTEPVCPKTPVQQRGRIPNLLKPDLTETYKKEKKGLQEKKESNTAPRPRARPPQTLEQRTPNEKRKIRRRSKAGKEPEREDFDLMQSGALTLSFGNSSISPTKKKIKRSSTSFKSARKKAKIEEQQGDLGFYFNEARRLGIEVSGLEQENKLLSPKVVAEFKQKVKEKKEIEKELLKEEKKKKIREKAAYNRKREDLICNDLKPLPKFPTLELPYWMKNEELDDYLFITQFFTAFKDILPLKEIRGNEEVVLSDVILAIKCNDPQNSPFADLMRVILSIRTDIADEEDGDEADINNREEVYLINTQNCDPINLTHGDSIREISDLHSKIRKIHGKSVRHLPVDWMTLSEVLRLIFETSGYYTGISTHRHRLYARGNFRGYEDPAFEFRMNHPEIITKLRTQTVFDLEPRERMEIVKALIYQLLTYSKLRNHLDKCQSELSDLKKEQKKLRAWDTAQEGEANAARLLLELDTKPDHDKSESSVIKKFKSHIKAHNEGRRYDKNDLDNTLLDSVPYSSLTLDEIVTARELQKAELTGVMDSLTSKSFTMYCKISDLRLGSDRAYRRYIVMDNLSAIFVENPAASELRVDCDEPSTIEKCFENCEENQEVFRCSGQTGTCSVHGFERNNRTRWCYIANRHQFNELLGSLNPRGVREVELMENLNQYRMKLLEILGKTEQLISASTWKEMLMTDAPDPAETYNIDWDTEIRDILLDFEEKMDQGLMGSIEKMSKVSRASWRKNLIENNDVVKLLKTDITILGEVVLTSNDDCQQLPIIRKLAIAFYMIVHSINLKFIKPPFLSPNKDEHGNLKPSEMFNRWQKALLQCESHSSLSLFITTFEGSIKWDKSRLQGKCKTCRRKAVAHELVLCIECDSCYHLKCAKMDAKSKHALTDWICVACKASRRKLENEAKRFKLLNAEEEISLNDITIDDNDFSVCSTEASTSNCIIKTASGRSVKKIQYSQIHEGLNLKNRKPNGLLTSSTTLERTHRNAPVKICDMGHERNLTQEEEHSSDGENTRKRKQPSKREFTLNDSTRVIIPNEKERMASIEQLLKETMRQEFSWPFLQPVDTKEVPDYYDVIKRPMDLRTMMNKIKQRVYNKPLEVKSDFQLVLSNCETYNETESEIYQLSQLLDVFVTARLDEIIGQQTK